MKKRLLQMFLLCLPLAVLLTVSAAAVTIHDVYTAADLAEMANGTDVYYLRNDIDLSNWGNWTPMDFSGTFDGMGHTIKGIKVSGNDRDGGLFNQLGGVTVRNLHIEVDIQTNSSESSRYIGGLAASLWSGTVRCVSVSGQIRTTCSGTGLSLLHIGGLVAYSQGTISNCYSNASITLTVENSLYSSFCGGLVGESYSGSSIVNSYATGKVAMTGLSLAKGYENGVYCDGLVGSAVEVKRSYFCNLHNPQLSGNGVYLTSEAMKQQDTYTDWDFSTVWDISPTVNDGFPFLRQPEEVPPESVSLNLGTLKLDVGKSQLLQATILPENATARHLDWYSSDTDVVTLTPVTHDSCGEINPRMMVNAKKPGVAVVTAVTTEGKIETACTVTVSDGQSEPLPTYRLDSISVQDKDGKALTAIPKSLFLATVSVTNIASLDSPTIMLAAYTDKNQFTGVFYVTLKSPVGGTIEATLPVDNSGGKIAQLKAFAVNSFADMSMIGNPVSFPA